MATVANVDRYLVTPATGCGPWIRLFATSNGMFAIDANVPEQNPSASRYAISVLWF